MGSRRREGCHTVRSAADGFHHQAKCRGPVPLARASPLRELHLRSPSTNRGGTMQRLHASTILCVGLTLYGFSVTGNGQTIRMKLPAQSEVISSLTFSPDRKTLASAGRDKSIKLWNVETGKEQDSFAQTDQR